MEFIEVISRPASTSVELSQLRNHLRLNDTSEDDLLSDWLYAADSLFERLTGYVLVSQSLRLRLDRFPPGGTIYIPRHPVTAVDSVEYLDTAGDWQEIDPSNYTVDTGSVPARVVFGEGFTFPELHPTAVPAVRVSFTAGHADTANVPKLATTAVRLLASMWYGQRESHGEADLKEVPLGFKAVCDQFDTGVLGSWNGGN